MNASSLFRLTVLTAALVLSACADRVSVENYNKLKTGQTYDEVKQIIGDPARCDEALGVRTCVWGDEKHSIDINFVSNKVLLTTARNLK